eukprot:112795_1
MAVAGVSFEHFLINFASKIHQSEKKFEVLKPNEIGKLNDVHMHSEDGIIKAYGLPHNVICIKHLFSEKEQIDLVTVSDNLYPSFHLQMSPFPQHTPWVYYNWPSKFMNQPDAEVSIKNDKLKTNEMELLLNLGSILGKMIITMLQKVKRQKENKDIGMNEVYEEKHNKNNNPELNQQPKQRNRSRYCPKAVYGILYPARGFLEAHTDAHQGWIVSISMGATCDFWFQDPKNKKDKNKYHVNIESGDVMIFPGYRLMHGVDDVQQTVPPFWQRLQTNHRIPLPFVRYCLQFRHPLK